MGKDWSMRPDVCNLVELKLRPLPAIPAGWGKRVGFRPHAEQIHHHEFTIAVPPRAQKTLFGHPPHGERLAPVQHPIPVGTLVKFARQLLYLFVVEETFACQSATQKQTCIDRGNFGVQDPLPRLAVHEVIEKSMLVLDAPQSKTQCRFHAVPYWTVFLITSLCRDT